MAEFVIQGREIVSKTVKKHGSGAIIYVPRDWVGEKVSVVREMEYDIKKLVKSMDRGKRIVYSYYVLDLVHRGHLLQMQNAKATVGKDGISIVGILTDEAVMERKAKPVLNFDERMLLAQSIKYNDFVVAQSTYSPLPNVKNIRPDILMESSSHKDNDINEARRVMAKFGGKVITTPYYPTISSTKIKEEIRRNIK
jgi:bifunctional ADP-heptose synthase (sugar kinase/adenylyltransferase)